MRNLFALRFKLPSLLSAVVLVCALQARGAGGPPVILTQPAGQSVSSGAAVSLQVVADGSRPLSYLWFVNGQRRPNVTGDTFAINPVIFTNSGNYQVVVTNYQGSVTSEVAKLTVDVELTFRLLALTTNSPLFVNEGNLTGLSRGGLALSSNHVFATGGGASGNSPATARYGLNFANSSLLGTGYDALVCNLRSGKIYTLANGSTPISYANNYLNYYAFNALMEIDEQTGNLTGTRIPLTRSISIDYPNYTGLCSGYDRIVVQGIGYGRVYNIALPSGEVTDLGQYPTPPHNYSDSWAYWGIAEYVNGCVSLVYVQDSTNIVRAQLPGAAVTTVATFQNLGRMSSLGFSPALSRWFFHSPSPCQFGAYSNVLGSAEASYTMSPDYPVITGHPLPQAVYIDSNAVFTVLVSGIDPFTYQWYFNGAPIANETHASLVLPNVQTNAAGFYSVRVTNPLGTAMSAQAALTVVTLPQIISVPAPRSVMQSSNTILTFTVDGAPPLSYQWLLNGTELPSLTTPSASLELDNMQRSQSGFYALVVNNRFGSVTSSPVEVFVSVPLDDGTDFQIASMTNTPFSVIETYNLFSAFECNPIAITSNSVFISSGSTMGGYAFRSARANSADLSGLSLIGRYYFAMISNLRTERAYVLGPVGGPPLNDARFTATAIFELDSTTGALGQRIDLSQSIPNIDPMNGVGIFSGYDRAVVLNGTRAYSIALPSGVVTDLGLMHLPSHSPDPFSGSFWGVAENMDGVTYLVFARNNTTIGRVRVPDGLELPGYNFYYLSEYMNSVSVSIKRGRWYFENLVASQFGSNNISTLGFAPATFYVDSGRYLDHFEWSPVASPQMANGLIPVTLYAKNSIGVTISNFNGTVYLAGTASPSGTNVLVSPASVNFVNGTWTGTVSVLQANTNVFLQAYDLEGHTGKSGNFRVVPMNDLGMTVSVAPSPVVIQQYLTYSIRVTNTGPDAATGVMLSNSFTMGSPAFVSASASQGSCWSTNGSVVCDLGTVSNVVDISVVLQATRTPLIASSTKIWRNEADPDLGNNTVTVFTPVVLPILAIQDAQITEGDSGTNFLTFNVTLNPPTNTAISVNYATSDGTARSSGLYQDFVAVSGTLNFTPGTTNQTFRVPILGDTVFEGNETFTVTLSGPINGSIGRATAIGTIINDDPIPVLTLSDVTLNEGDVGTTNAVFNLTLSSMTGADVILNYATSNGTATAGSDYVAKSGSIIFGAESTDLVRSISVIVNSDTNPEPDETFTLVLTGITNALAPQTVATCTIVNDDAVGQLHHFSWDVISSPQAIDTPFIATLTAMDYFDQPLPDFTGPVNLSALLQQPSTVNTILGDLTPDYNYTGGVYTIGFLFTPTNDIRVTQVRSFTGSKVSIWTDTGVLLASQHVSSPPGTWSLTPLATPVQLQGNHTYCVGFYTGDGVEARAWTFASPLTFPNGTIGRGVVGMGDMYPNQDLGADALFLVDLVYDIPKPSIPITMEPTISDTFSGGVWIGKLRITQAGTNVYLQADDGAGHIGQSNPFDVKDITDLAISMVMPSAPVPAGAPMSYSLTVQNNSTYSASGIMVSNFLPAGVTFVSVEPDTVPCSVSQGLVLCQLGDLGAGEQTSISINLRPQTAGDFQINVSVQPNEADMFPDDNQTSGSFTAVLGVPIITAPPVSLSVTSGATAQFSVEVIGAEPLQYQWFCNGTNVPNRTNALLVLTNVSFLNYGLYTVVVSNQYGVAVSQPAELRIDDHLTFQILQLGTNGLRIINEQPLTGYGKGGVGVSSNYVLVTGRGPNGNSSVSARHALRDLSGGVAVGAGLDALACNLRNGKIYSLANGNTSITYVNYELNFSSVDSLLEINESTGLPSGNRIVLSRSIPITTYLWVGVFSGVDRIVIQGAWENDGYHIYDIALPSGQVRDLGALYVPSTTYCYNWCYFGLVEYFGGSLHLVYAQDSYTIVRRQIPGGAISTLASWDYLGYYMSTIGFSLPASRWYFSIPYDSQFSSGYNTLVSGKATYTTNPDYPAIVQQPYGSTVYVGHNASFSVQASGRGAINYQWRFNGIPIPGATNSTLSLTNVQPADQGDYTVVISSYVGSIESVPAYLNVISSPFIIYPPLDTNSYVGSNVTFRVIADGAPPLYYQWRFNGTNILDATNATLFLNELSFDQAGQYSVIVSNSYGSVTSSPPANLYIFVVHDDGTVFKVDFLTNNSKIIGQGSTGGDDRGGIGISSRYVFYSTDNGTIKASLDDLSGLTSLGSSTYYDGIVCNLRSEIAYLLASGTTMVRGSSYNGIIDTLLELNSDGTLSGRSISLSRQIPVYGSSGSGQVGIFSSYDRIVIHNRTNIYNVALPSGIVTVLGALPEPNDHYNSENWAYWGIAEFWGGFVYLNYVNYNADIVRMRVPDGMRSVNAAFYNLSDMACFTASISRKRWYFHYEYNGQFGGDSGGGNETLGYADANFTIFNPNADHFEWSPIASPQRSGGPFIVTILARNSTNELATNYHGTATLAGLSSPAGTNVLISPMDPITFTNGIWSGAITVLQANTNMYLRADDPAGLTGNSAYFRVNPANDLSVIVIASPSPVVVNQYLTYSIRVTNNGPGLATGVMLTNTFSIGSPAFISVGSSQGSCSNANGSIVCSLETVTNFVDISLVMQPTRTPLISSVTKIWRNEADADLGNNSITLFTSVVQPILAIQDARLTEGNSGTNWMIFNVTLNPPTNTTISVNYATANGTAFSAGTYPDYVATSGTLTFSPGSSNQTISVPILGDTIFELDETFTVTLSSAVGGYIGRAQATGTILNDDPIPSLSVSDVTVTEGASATSAVFNVTLSAMAGADITASFTTSNGTAKAGSDYAPTNGTIIFGRETTDLVRNVSVRVNGDSVPEFDETFYLVLTGITNALAAKTTGVCTIVNDDGIGILDHFTWSSISSPKYIDAPFFTTLKAEDFFGTVISNFTGTVNLSASAVPYSPQSLLVSLPTSNSFTGGYYTIGFVFTPTNNLLVTDFRHLSGSSVSLWTETGELLATKAVTSTSGTWVTSRLDSPVQLSAGSNYMLAFYGGQEQTYYYSDTAGTNFTDGYLRASYYTETNAFPTNNIGIGTYYLVDLVYSRYEPVKMTPANATFVRGKWSGNVTILESATNVMITADDGVGHFGQSNPFNVLHDVHINYVRVNGPDFLCSFHGASGMRYRLERTSRLPATNWTFVTEFTVGDQETVELFDKVPDESPTQYYRIQAIPNP